MILMITVDETVDGYRLDIADYRRDTYGTTKENPERYSEVLERLNRWVKEEAEKEFKRLKKVLV